ncbi:hypothetical protein Hanom_Chr10g00877611 [Helianthus anomalus]
MVVGLCRVTATAVNSDDSSRMTVMSNDGHHSKRDNERIRRERLRRRGSLKDFVGSPARGVCKERVQIAFC